MNSRTQDESRFSRALADTSSAFKTIKFYLFVLFVDVVVAAIIFMIRDGLYDPQVDATIPVSFGVLLTVVPLAGGSLLALVLLFLFNLERAPSRQRDDARSYAQHLDRDRKEGEADAASIEIFPFTGEGMAQLRITNTGSSTIRCQGDMRSISPQPSKAEKLPYTIRWKGANPSLPSPGLTEIVGGGSRVLEVAQHTSSHKDSRTAEMYLYRADGDDYRFRVSTIFNEPVLCEIAILCEPALEKSQIQTFSIIDDGGVGIVEFKKLDTSETPSENI